MLAEREPLDVRKLKKGDYIPPEECERMISVKRTHRDYGLAMVNLKSRIEGALREEGILLSLGIQKDGIKIHMDDEASNHHSREGNRAVRKLARAARAMATLVDRSMLSDGMREEHDRNTALLAMRVQAVRGAGRAFAAEVRKNQIETKPTLGAATTEEDKQ